MTPEQGRSEWQRWASRADELRRDVERWKDIADDSTRLVPGTIARDVEWFHRATTALLSLRAAQRLANERLGALREYAPKETT